MAGHDLPSPQSGTPVFRFSQAGGQYPIVGSPGWPGSVLSGADRIWQFLVCSFNKGANRRPPFSRRKIFLIFLAPGNRPDGPGWPGDFDFRPADPKRTIPGQFRPTFWIYWCPIHTGEPNWCSTQTGEPNWCSTQTGSLIVFHSNRRPASDGSSSFSRATWRVGSSFSAM